MDHRHMRSLKEYKNFVNWNVKQNMLLFAIKKLAGLFDGRLIDLGCGRGNDLNRWDLIKEIQSVVAMDISEDQIKEAINRYKGYRNKAYTTRERPLNVCYLIGSITSREDLSKINAFTRRTKYSLIVNNLCMNHLFESEAGFRVFMKYVSDSLVTGGLFIGTAADGDVIEALARKQKDNTIQDEWVFIQLEDRDSEESFGKRCRFKLHTPFFQDSTGEFQPTEEYVLNKETVIRIAEEYRLVPVALGDGISPLFNFNDFPVFFNNITGAYYERLNDITRLYFGFSFTKI